MQGLPQGEQRIMYTTAMMVEVASRRPITPGGPPAHHVVLCGKALQVDPFTGERSEIQLDDWLSNLKRVVHVVEWMDR